LTYPRIGANVYTEAYPRIGKPKPTSKERRSKNENPASKYYKYVTDCEKWNNSRAKSIERNQNPAKRVETTNTKQRHAGGLVAGKTQTYNGPTQGKKERRKEKWILSM
jgi:hypothetical protein